MKTIIKFFCVTILFVSCSEDDFIVLDQNQVLVDKVYNYNNNLIGEYFYNDNNQLTKRKDTDPINNRSSQYEFRYTDHRISEIIYTDFTYPSLNHNILIYYNEVGQIVKDETYKNGLQIGERHYTYYPNGRLKGLVNENGLINPTFIYNEHGNVDAVRLLTSPDYTDEIIYHYEYDCAATPNFGLGSIFQIEPLPYFGTEAVLPKNLSCHNMTLNLQSGTQLLYEYNAHHLPKTIEVLWEGIETVDPMLWRISYREIQ